ncbi:MAG TPA: hypothetical protein DCL21_00865 [Alphaproteobacteria bacterium]|nr:hypothetical protein [Alphaproteobacteria bacterium]
MKNPFNFDAKLSKAIDKYSKTTESLLKFNQQIMQKQYDTALEIVKTLNSIDLGMEAPKPAEKKAEPKKAPVAPVKKEESKKTEPKGAVKASIRAAVAKKETSTTKPAVKAEIIAAVAKKPVAKKAEPNTVVKKAPIPAKKVEEKKAATKPTAKKVATKKPTTKKAAKKAAKSSSQDRLAALKQATQHAVKTNKLN